MNFFDNSFKHKLAGYTAIFLLSSLSSIGSLFGDFVFDDTEAIVNNRDVYDNSTPLLSILQNDFWGTKLTHNQSHKSFRPLTVLTFRLNFWSMGRLVPWNFHLVNILLHILICLLLWKVYIIILGKEKTMVCFWAACLFAAHPIHTEAVCGIVGRADLLAALFFLLSFISYTHCSNDWSFTACCLLLLSIVLAAAAMFCKEYGITVLGFNLAYEVLAVQNVEIRKIFRNYGRMRLPVAQALRGAVVILSAAFFVGLRCYLMDFQSPNFQKADNPASFESDWLAKVLTLQYVACLNVWLLLCPDWLSFDWSMGCVPIIRELVDIRIIASVCCWSMFGSLLISACFFRASSSQRSILLSLSLLIIPFMPASNLLFRVGFVIAERVLYIPSAGFCLVVAIGMERLLAKKDIMVPFVFLLLVFLIKSHMRSLEWRSEARLFTSALRVCPNNAKVRYNVAKSAADRGLTDRAISEYREAIRLFPEYDQALNNLANLLKSKGEIVEAERLLRRALKIRPDFPAAWMNLGIVLASTKRFSEAEKCYSTALKLRKHYPDCYYNIGNLYLEQNLLTEAEQAWLNSTRLKPSMTMAWNNLIMLKDNQGEHHAAIIYAQEAIAQAGDVASFYFNMANAYGKLADYENAEQYFKRALTLDRNNALYYVNLGVLYHRWKKYSLAEGAYLDALRLNPKLNSAKQNYVMLKKKLKKDSLRQ